MGRVFWHKLLRRAFVEHARFFVRKVLRMPQETVASRYMIMLAVFFISAFMHIVSLQISISCGGPYLVAYYCGIAVVIALEHLVEELYERYFRNTVRKGSYKDKPYWRVMGYLWVAFFHIWTTPKVVYPIMFCPCQ